MLIVYRLLAILIFLYPLGLMINYGGINFKNFYRVNVDWYQNVDKNQLIKNRVINSYPHFNRNFFYNKNQLLYYNPDGLVLHKINIDSKTLVAPDHQYYTVSPMYGNRIELFSFTGEKLWALDTYSIPFITPFKKNIVLMSSDNNSITIYDYNRNLVFEQSYLGSLVTDYAVCNKNDSIVFGTIEGDIHFYDYTAKLLFKNTYQESKYNLIKSVTCSPSGSYVVALAGLYPEKKLLYDQHGNLLWSKNTDQDRRTPTDMFADDLNQLLFDRQANMLKVQSLKDGSEIKDIIFSSSQLPVSKTIITSTSGWILVGINGVDNTLMILNQDLNPIWTTQYNNEKLSYGEIAQMDNSLFVQVHTSSSIYNYQITLP